jgi:hypothetical protein
LSADFLTDLSFSSAAGRGGRRDLPTENRHGDTPAIAQGDRGPVRS